MRVGITRRPQEETAAGGRGGWGHVLTGRGCGEDEGDGRMEAVEEECSAHGFGDSSEGGVLVSRGPMEATTLCGRRPVRCIYVRRM